MSSILYSPFNYDSGTFAIKTASYTVPSGKFVKAIPLEADCAINSNFVERTITGSTGGSWGATTRNYYVFCELPEDPHYSIGATWLRTSGNTARFGILYKANITANILMTENLTDSRLIPIGTVGSGGTIIFNQSQYYNIAATSYLDQGTVPTNVQAKRFLVLYSDSSGASSCFFDYTLRFLRNKHEYWLKAGDVITGTRWNITEYNSIT